jgi:hypothetical protein
MITLPDHEVLSALFKSDPEAAAALCSECIEGFIQSAAEDKQQRLRQHQWTLYAIRREPKYRNNPVLAAERMYTEMIAGLSELTDLLQQAAVLTYNSAADTASTDKLTIDLFKKEALVSTAHLQCEQKNLPNNPTPISMSVREEHTTTSIPISGVCLTAPFAQLLENNVVQISELNKYIDFHRQVKHPQTLPDFLGLSSREIMIALNRVRTTDTPINPPTRR